MNKNILIGSLAAVMGMTLVSCNNDGHSELNMLAVAPAVSIITSLQDGSVTASAGAYAYNIKIVDDSPATVVVTSPQNLIANNNSLTFSTNEQGYKSSGRDFYVENANGTAGSSFIELNNANFLALNPYLGNVDPNLKYGYYYNESQIGEYTFNFIPSPNPYIDYNYITLANYKIGSSYIVKTFPVNTFFKGETTTTYPQNPEGFKNSDITYRFIINQDKETSKFSVDLVIYDAKFAAEMPVTISAIVVTGLDVEFTADGVYITGKDKDPKYFEGGSYLPLPSYTFNEIEFHTTNGNYTKGELNYTVGGRYQGHFEGEYCKTYYMN